MIQGFYRVHYHLPKRQGFCICVLKAGQIAGGGGLMHYTGSYKQIGRQFVGEMHAKMHAGVSETVFHGLKDFYLQLSGMVCGGYGQIAGEIVEVPDAVVRATISRLSMI